MRTERGFDRLVNFSDAVVAIAVTLLVLPLVDIARQAPSGRSVAHILSDNGYQLFAFALSFAVIGVMWRAHHSLFEHLRDYDEVILRINELWLFTIILLPFTTELLNRKRSGSVGNGLYVGTLLVSSASLSAIAWRVQHHPDLRHPDSHAVPGSRLDDMPWITAVLLAVALVLVVALPRLNMWPLLVLFLEAPIRAVLKRRRTADALG
jgi:uncharacterized membrane protein